MIIALINQKGGVGKTTVTLNLGAALAEAGHRVVLLDLDPQRDLSAYAKSVSGVVFEEATPDNLPELLRREADFFLLDCPPALGAQSAAALKVADVALVPLQTEFLALRGLKRMHDTIEAARSPRLGNNRKLKLKILLTLTDTRDPASAAIIEDVRGRFPGETLQTLVKRSPLFSGASLARTSILSHSPRSHGAAAFRALAQEIVDLA